MNTSVANHPCQSFLQALSEATVLVNGRDGSLIDANRPAKCLLDTEDWQGQPLQNWLQNSPTQLANCLKRCSRSRNPVAITLHFKQADSEAYESKTCEAMLIKPAVANEAALIAIRYKADADGVERFVALNREITKQKQALQKLQHSQAALKEVTSQLEAQNKVLADSNQQLQYEIQQREAAEQAMRSAKLIAERANQAKTTFLANMSHELRTPLNGILGYAQILEHDKQLSHSQQEQIGVIKTSGEYLLTLINDILDLSKIESGHFELFKQDFHLGKFMDSVNALFQIRARQKKISFVYEALNDLPIGLHADEKRLRQIVINLLSNAVKFTQEGGVILKASYQQQQLVLEVEDTGVGIDEEDLPLIFQPFKQIGNNLNKSEGTGLGLAIVQNLVDLMGGELLVSSIRGRGSCFTVRLPLPTAQGEIQLRNENPDKVVGFTGAARRILIVDDRWENRSLLTNMLSPLGFQIFEADNGQQGLSQAHALKPDLILTDLVMPVLDGFEMMRKIRHHSELHKLPIIAVSASVFGDSREHCHAAGCDEFINKPVHLDELLAKLQKLLNLTWVYEQANTHHAVSLATHNRQPTTRATSASITTPNPAAHTTIVADEPLIAPAAEVVQQLFEFAMRGDVGGIIKYLDKLDYQHTNPYAKPFYDKVRTLAKAFDEEQLCDLLERYQVQPLCNEPQPAQCLQ